MMSVLTRATDAMLDWDGLDEDVGGKTQTQKEEE